MRLRPLRVPRAQARCAPWPRCRSSSPPWSWRRRSWRCWDRAARSTPRWRACSACPGRRSASTARSGRSCWPASSTTWRSCSGWSAGCGRTSIRHRRKRRGCWARRPWRAFREVTLAAPAPGRGVRRLDRVPVHGHLVRRGPPAGRRRAIHARDRDLPPDRPPARPPGRGRAGHPPDRGRLRPAAAVRALPGTAGGRAARCDRRPTPRGRHATGGSGRSSAAVLAVCFAAAGPAPDRARGAFAGDARRLRPRLLPGARGAAGAGRCSSCRRSTRSGTRCASRRVTLLLAGTLGVLAALVRRLPARLARAQLRRAGDAAARHLRGDGRLRLHRRPRPAAARSADVAAR